jgi:hypothetical protein
MHSAIRDAFCGRHEQTSPHEMATFIPAAARGCGRRCYLLDLSVNGDSGSTTDAPCVCVSCSRTWARPSSRRLSTKGASFRENLRELGGARDARPRAVAVKTNANGYSLGARDDAPKLTWNGSIPMVAVQDRLACWEITRAIPYGEPPIVVFGFAVVIPQDLAHGQPRISCGWSPFFTTAAAGQPNRGLPVPRFTPNTVAVNFPLLGTPNDSK